MRKHYLSHQVKLLWARIELATFRSRAKHCTTEAPGPLLFWKTWHWCSTNIGYQTQSPTFSYPNRNDANRYTRGLSIYTRCKKISTVMYTEVIMSNTRLTYLLPWLPSKTVVVPPRHTNTKPLQLILLSYLCTSICQTPATLEHLHCQSKDWRILFES